MRLWMSIPPRELTHNRFLKGRHHGKPLRGARLFLIGSDASHAMSPSLWNPVLKELGSPGVTRAGTCPPGQACPAVRARLLDGDVVAANVTMPHKQWAAQAADTVSEPVRLSGAANLLIGRGNELAAYNTDITAVATLLGDRPQRHAVMFGAGGAARAALVALRGRVTRVTVATGTPARRPISPPLLPAWAWPPRRCPGLKPSARPGTPHSLSMPPPSAKEQATAPVWGDGALAEDAVVYDFVYAGHVTASIAAATRQGLRLRGRVGPPAGPGGRHGAASGPRTGSLPAPRQNTGGNQGGTLRQRPCSAA